jgi:hypothetical protein
VGAGKASESEPLMTCRNRIGGVETGVESVPRDERGGNLSTAHAAPGMKAARARVRLWCGTWEPVAPRLSGRSPGVELGGRREGGPQAAGTARGRVPMWGTGADRPVLAVKPGNAGGAKGAGCPVSSGGQP